MRRREWWRFQNTMADVSANISAGAETGGGAKQGKIVISLNNFNFIISQQI